MKTKQQALPIIKNAIHQLVFLKHAFYISHNPFISMISNPEQYELDFTDFQSALTHCNEFASGKLSVMLEVLDFFTILSILHNHSKSIMTSTSPELTSIFRHYYSIQIIILLIKYQPQHLDTPMSFRSEIPPKHFLSQGNFPGFMNSFIFEFNPDQKNLFFDKLLDLLQYFHNLALEPSKIVPSHYTHEEVVSNISSIYISLFTKTFETTTKSHIELFYSEFLTLHTEFFDAAFLFLTKFQEERFFNSKTIPYSYTRLFSHPYFSALAFNDGNPVFLKHAKVKQAKKTHPDYFF